MFVLGLLFSRKMFHLGLSLGLDFKNFEKVQCCICVKNSQTQKRLDFVLNNFRNDLTHQFCVRHKKGSVYAFSSNFVPTTTTNLNCACNMGLTR